MDNFQKILVANRGEIALRIIRAIHGLDKRAMAVYALPDAALPFVSEADEAYSLGRGTLEETYLRQEKMLELALQAGADAIHPGYGFLAENPGFARACEQAGIAFIGPTAEAIEAMGNKSMARKTAQSLGVPVLEGQTGNLDELISQKDHLSYPLLVKPAAGGGGKGMHLVRHEADFEEAAGSAAREARSYFGSGELYVEKYLDRARHIEVQVLADRRGNTIHLFERECTLQRRYQKIIEEAPSPSIDQATLEGLIQSALKLAKGIAYVNAGTLEFLVDEDQCFYFMEMNTRIQVEHPVTEMVTGVDLVQEQIRIAEGYPLSLKQEDIRIQGHAIEARLYAEDPVKGFMPSTGRIGILDMAGGDDLRIDQAYRAGNKVEAHYDPLLAKIIVRGQSREDARNKLIGALKDYHLSGPRNNRDFLLAMLRSASFTENRIHTRHIDLEQQAILSLQQEDRESVPLSRLLAAATLIALRSGAEKQSESSPWLRIGHWRMLPQIVLEYEGSRHHVVYKAINGIEEMVLVIDGREHEVSMEAQEGRQYRIRVDHHMLQLWGGRDRSEIFLDMDGHWHTFRRPQVLDLRYAVPAAEKKGEQAERIVAPLNGRVVQLLVKPGHQVREGESLLVIESMKMENKVLAPGKAHIREILVTPGEQVQANQLIITLDNYE